MLKKCEFFVRARLDLEGKLAAADLTVEVGPIVNLGFRLGRDGHPRHHPLLQTQDVGVLEGSSAPTRHLDQRVVVCRVVLLAKATFVALGMSELDLRDDFGIERSRVMLIAARRLGNFLLDWSEFWRFLDRLVVL